MTKLSLDTFDIDQHLTKLMAFFPIRQKSGILCATTGNPVADHATVRNAA